MYIYIYLCVCGQWSKDGCLHHIPCFDRGICVCVRIAILHSFRKAPDNVLISLDFRKCLHHIHPQLPTTVKWGAQSEVVNLSTQRIGSTIAPHFRRLRGYLQQEYEKYVRSSELWPWICRPTQMEQVTFLEISLQSHKIGDTKLQKWGNNPEK